MKVCKIIPSSSTCQMCVDTAETFDSIPNCGECNYHTKEYEILGFVHGVLRNSLALLLINGKIKEIPIERITDIRDVTGG